MKNQQYLWSEQSQEAIDPQLMQFLAGDDVTLDRHLLIFDIQATQVHIKGLCHINVVTEKESEAICDCLSQLQREFEQGEFLLDERYEDGHSAIEFYLVKHLGELGKKAHTGRSRNDQVLTCTRLFMKHHLQQIKKMCRSIAEQLINLADQHKETAMPGYTHLQRAMPNTVAVWLLATAEAMIDDAYMLNSTLSYVNSCPLGTAAGFGVPLDLPREYVAETLGFERVQVNPVYAQNSRGKYELLVLQNLYHILLNVRRFCWDLSLFMTQEFDFVGLKPSHTTGSSIMPNKTNPDVVELMRSSLSMIEGSMAQIQSLISLPSGYQRDLQMSKEPLIKSLLFSEQVLTLLPGLIDALIFKKQNMEEAISQEMMATDQALQQVNEGLSFRQAYVEAKTSDNDITYKDSLNRRISLGAAANLGLETLRKRLNAI